MNSQLELGFSNLNRHSLHSRRRARLERARCWFQLMRSAVENASDWPATAEERSGLQQALEA